MLFVVDTNILFTHFWPDSVFSKISFPSVRLVSPEFSLFDIENHSAELMEKAKLSKAEFLKLRQKLAEKVDFIRLEEYSSEFRQVFKSGYGFSGSEHLSLLKDIDFLALASKLNCPLWSNDRLLKRQSKVEVVDTRSMIELLGSVPV